MQSGLVSRIRLLAFISLCGVQELTERRKFIQKHFEVWECASLYEMFLGLAILVTSEP
jgi:hypothetical protein